jgi:hypothetical protein
LLIVIIWKAFKLLQGHRTGRRARHIAIVK